MLLDNDLSGVSCTSNSSCFAVGYHSDGHTQQTLIERWNGISWSIVPSPDGNGGPNAYLTGISCRSSIDCTAVGAVQGRTFNQPLIEHWNGDVWGLESAPKPKKALNSYLTGVSCASVNACTAVGRFFSGSVFHTLVEERKETGWSIVKGSAPTVAKSSELSGVSCASASRCMAVGDFAGPRARRTLIERRQGSRWSIVSSANTNAGHDNYLTGVSCFSSRACTAVGHSSTGTSFVTLIEQWNGSDWAMVPSPNVNPNKTNYLTGVSCLLPSVCTAVGYFDVVSNQPLIAQTKS
jgi:hypothetical protein